MGFDVKPLITGAELSPDGRYSGVALADDIGLSKCRLIGVKLLLSSRSLLTMLTGVNVAGAILTGVKPPALTGVNPDVTGGGGGACGACDGESSMGISLKPLSDSVFSEPLSASEARTAGDDPPRRLDGVFKCDFFIGELAGDGVRGPPYSYSSCRCTPGFASRRYSSYGCNHLWYEFFSEVDNDDMIFPL